MKIKKAIYQKYANMFNPNNVAFNFDFADEKTFFKLEFQFSIPSY